MAQPYWLVEALTYLGVKEIFGPEHNQIITTMWQKIKSSIRDDETPWCAAFVGAVLEDCRFKSSRSAAARSYAKWGTRLADPAVGAIVTFWRGSPAGWSGHVGFIVGKDQNGNLMVLGGNQGNEVSIKPFALSRVLAYSWPESIVIPYDRGIDKLPIVLSNGRLSTNEA